MKVKVFDIELEGAERKFEFSDGLNLITGPISSGKTTLLECIRAILGSTLSSLNDEARETVTSLRSKVRLGKHDFTVIRPYKTTRNAIVTISGDGEAERLPVMQASKDKPVTYRDWIMEKLELPQMRVAKAPTKIDTDTSPITINDYMMHAHMPENEISRHLIGDFPHNKRRKRQSVFKIIYGIYGPETAKLENKLRNKKRRISSLKNRTSTIEEILENTVLRNRAEIEDALEAAKNDLKELRAESVEEARQIEESYGTSSLREDITFVESKLSKLREDLHSHQRSIEEKREVIAQLETQVRRLTKSMVANEFLIDFDFVVCPRCGSDLNQHRSDEGACYLCLQDYEAKQGVEEIENEIQRVEKQISESQELVQYEKQKIEALESEIHKLKQRRESIGHEINFKTRSFISDSSDKIKHRASKIGKTEEKIEKLKEYSKLLNNIQATEQEISRLESEIENDEAELESKYEINTKVLEKIDFLEEKFRYHLQRLNAPEFSSEGRTYIDKDTFIPFYQGKNINSLSPGLTVLVNTAYIAAHQVTSLKFGLPVPNIILADSLSGPIGGGSNNDADLDPERVSGIYHLLKELADDYGLQIFVADKPDGSAPEDIEVDHRIRFSEHDRLIPEHLI